MSFYISIILLLISISIPSPTNLVLGSSFDIGTDAIFSDRSLFNPYITQQSPFDSIDMDMNILNDEEQEAILAAQKKIENHNDTEALVEIPKTVVTFINGIYHSEEDWRRIAKMLEDFFEVEVLPLYNPTTGWWVGDATRAGYELVRSPADARMACNLTSHLRMALEVVGPKGRVLHIAHSGGAILTYLSAKFHLTAEERQRIDVITMGAGRSITRKYFPGGRVVNYYANNDPCLFVENRAKTLLKRIEHKFQPVNNINKDSNNNNKGDKDNKDKEKNKDDSYKTGQSLAGIFVMNGCCKEAISAYLQLQSGDMEMDDGITIDDMLSEVTYTKHNTSFVFLKGLTKHVIRDHAMEEPTYRFALAREATIFHKLRQAHLESLYDLASRGDWIRNLRKTCAQMTGQHRFWTRMKTSITEKIPNSFYEKLNVKNLLVSSFSTTTT